MTLYLTIVAIKIINRVLQAIVFEFDWNVRANQTPLKTHYAKLVIIKHNIVDVDIKTHKNFNNGWFLVFLKSKSCSYGKVTESIRYFVDCSYARNFVALRGALQKFFTINMNRWFTKFLILLQFLEILNYQTMNATTFVARVSEFLLTVTRDFLKK